MPDKFKSLTEILEGDKAFSKFRKRIKENNVIEEFENIFPELSKTVKPSRVTKGVLYLIVDNSVLRSELYQKKSLIVKKINDFFKQKIIVNIKFSNFRN